jgi:predicted naringenin-chalcone synthase
MFITGLGTANPPYRYTQTDCLRALEGNRQFLQLRPASQQLLAKILQSAHGIATRNFALADLSQAFDLVPDILHRRFLENAPKLAAQAAVKALDEAGLIPADIDAVVISTCTGYLCPGLTSYVIERMGMRLDVLALDLVGQGCGAAIPNMRSAEALLTAGRARHVLSICVEVCSAALYLDDDPGVLVSACLFGDGAGAAVLSAELGAGPHTIEWIDCTTITNPQDRDLLRFEHRDGMLRNILSPRVPELAAHYAKKVLNELLPRCGLVQNDIAGWVWHGGGKNVLDALQQQLTLSDSDVHISRMILNDYGNLSSAFVYFVLQAALSEQSRPGWWWMSSFGAGFSCHGALLKIS